jgi:hypothetical protein
MQRSSDLGLPRQQAYAGPVTPSTGPAYSFRRALHTLALDNPSEIVKLRHNGNDTGTPELSTRGGRHQAHVQAVPIR